MDVKEENKFTELLCHACLCVGRSVYKITNENLIKYYLDALEEIPLSKTKQSVNITVCWECKAILQKSWSFREQAKDCYRILLAYTHENLDECLLTDVSRPPHLQFQNLDSINIYPSEIEIDIPCDKVKDDIHIDDVNDDIDTDDVKDDIDIDDVKDDIDIDDVKDDISIDEVKNEIIDNCAYVKNELSDDCVHFDNELSDQLECRDIIPNDLKEDGRPEIFDNNTHIKENDDEQLKAELETIICSMEREGKKIRREVKHKAKRSKKTVKRKEKKLKSSKIDQKVITIELSYDEMLKERKKELQRESYLKAKYKCETCIIGFNYKKSYQTHLNSKHSPELGEYICPICKVIISSVDSFTSHYKRHMRRYECFMCHKRTADYKVMEQHYYATHEISLKKYTCNICGKVSNSVDTHRYHKDTHKARVQCPECDKTFRHRAGLMNHRLAVHEFHNAFPCTVCDKVFRWKTSLKRHLQKHEAKNKSSTPAAPFCSMCSISFSSLCSYQRHMRNSLKHVTQDQLRFICDHCKRRFSDKTKLRDHIEEKHLNKTYQCHICSKPSKNRVGLDQHIRNVHKGRPKNKMCHHCGRGFPTKMQLESHIRTHTGERPFICEFCPTTFSQQSNLYKHNRQVHLNIKTKRYPICKKRKEDDPDHATKVAVLDNQTVIEEPYRPIVLQYSPERGFVL